MGMIRGLLGMLFGSGRNVVAETAEVFRENAEAAGVRAADHRGAVVTQYAGEFATARTGWFDGLIDGLNRLPRPMMAFGVLGLMAMAMIDPVWFAQRMVGIGLVPEPLWWLMGAIVSFYFGARVQAQGERFQRSIAETMARVPQVVSDIGRLDALRPDTPQVATARTDARTEVAAIASQANPALEEWRRAA